MQPLHLATGLATQDRNSKPHALTSCCEKDGPLSSIKSHQATKFEDEELCQKDPKGAPGICLLAAIPWPFGYLDIPGGLKQQFQFPLRCRTS